MKRKKAMKSIIKNNNIPIKLMLLAILVTLGCERQEIPLPAAKYPNTAEVFMDGFSAGLEYAAFGDSKVTAFAVDENVSFEDVILSSSMRFDIPYEGDPEGPYAGGIFRDLGGRDLSEYNALTFYAQGSKTGTIDQIGFGNDFLGDQYSTSTSINLNTSWTKYILPIPDPSKLTQEKGLFLISEGPEEGEGYSIWVDQVKFENLGTIAQPRAAMLGGNDVTQKTFIGSRAVVSNLTYTVNLPNGADQTVGAAPAYFSFASSDTLVAKVSDAGLVSVVGEGTAVITATLGELDVAGSLTLESLGEFTAAPTPPQDAADVISIFSNAYDNVPVEYYNGFWGGSTTLGGADIEINGDVVIKYSQLNYVGTQFSQPTVDASAMTHFHIDIQVEDDMEDGDFIRLELNDFGPDGAFGGGDDTGGSITFTSPSLETGTWAGLDIPLSGITGLTSTANMAQIIFVSDATISNILVDNMYFYKDDGGGGTPVPPTSPAPTPSQPEADVISIYSDAYTDVPNSGYNNYGAAAFEEVDISGDKSLKYTFVAGDNGNFQIIELGGDNQIDAAAAGMTNFRFDAWFPNAVDGSSTFLLKLVDIGAATTEGSVNVGSASNPVMEQGKWLSFDIPFTELESSGLGGKANIQQIVIDLMNSGEVYVDNIYMYKTGSGAVAPTSPAPTPTQPEADVISIYSDAYTDVPNSGYNNYGAAAFEEVDISGDKSLKYTFVAGDNGNFQIIELGGDNQIDAAAAGMTNFRFDAWFPNAVDGSSTFLLKLVDIGAATTEGSVNVGSASNPVMEQGKWLSFDIPFTELESSGLGGKANIQQIVIDLMNSGEVYVDNIYMYKTGSGAVAPTSPAPTPTQPEADVISIYSDAYTDVPNSGYNNYGAAAFEEVDISGDKSLKYTFVAGDNGNFQIIELGGDNQIDAAAAGMTNFRFDAWFPNAVDGSSTFLLKLVDIGAATTEGSVNVGSASNPVMEQGKWLSFDIPFTELESSGLGGKANIQQIVIDLMNSGEVYVDNIYMYKTGSGAVAPTSPAPTPTQPEADVISIYSDAYTDVPNSGYNNYGAAAFEEVDISGDKSLKYTFVAGDNGNFQIIELGGDNQIDAAAAGMTNFRFDAWFPNAVDGSSTFLLKLVDIGAATTEGSVNVGSASNPVMEQGKWLSFDIPFTELESSGLGGKANIQQIVIDLMNSGEVYVDNIYMYKTGSGAVAPTSPAPTPTQPEADVISIYSDAYTDVPNSGYNNYGAAAFEEVDISGDKSLKYTFVAGDNGNFQIIELGGDNQIDAAAAGMTNFRFDAWFPNAVDGSSTFLLKLVDIGAATTEGSVNVGSASNPVMEQGKWLSFDIPFTELESSGLGGKANIQQIVIDLMNSGEVYVDNIYMYKSGGGGGATAPTDAPVAPPTRDAEDVKSIYGEAYGAEVGLANVDWDNGSAFTEETIASNKLLKIDFADFLGTQLNSVVDATAMTNFHMDVWIADDFEAGQIFNPKWSNHAGGDGETNAFELTKAIGDTDAKKWLSIDVPITDFTGDATRANLEQFLIAVAGKIGVAYVDNIYFYRDGGGGGATAPTDAPAAPPTRDAEDVISVYGEAYGAEVGLANVDWDNGSTFTEETIASNKLLKIDFADFLGTQLNSVVDATAMTNFHMDVWVADDFEAGQIFNPKWSNHTGGAGETNAFELTKAVGAADAKKWIAIDVPISDFTGPTTRAHLAQFLIAVAGKIGVAYVDNIYFYKTGGGSANDPDVAAPTPPTRDAADVVSIFSDAYTNIALENDDAGWCGADAAAVVTIEGSSTWKKNAGIDCHGIDFSTNKQDLSAFTHIHFDFYTDDTDLTGDVFNVKLVDFGGGGGEASALEVNINTGTTPGIVSGSWVSVDIDITALGGVVAGDLTRSDIAQIGITTANLTNVWYDNIFLYK
jgi:serine phosphatase RsbU (regulator of sigma subunit)